MRYDDDRPGAERLRSWARENWAVILATLVLVLLMGWAVSTLV